MNVLVIGASRGIGLEFVRQYRADGAKVTATARQPEGVAALRALGAEALSLDVADAVSASGLGWPLADAGFHVAIYNAGVYGPRHAGLQAPTLEEFDAVMHVNVLGAMRALQAFAAPGVLARGAKVVVLSSRMGSIGERRSSSGWLYRASKAALNSLLVDASLQIGARATCVAVHPGWVRTDMGGAQADLDAAASVRDLRRLIAGLGPSDNGRFLNHDGQPIDW
jgi:NAD(P)-dependent dehydrogenase (short-subunit alcohol dehydrogenase family)